PESASTARVGSTSFDGKPGDGLVFMGGAGRGLSQQPVGSGHRLAGRVKHQATVEAESVGVTQVGERIWLVTFMQHDLGYFDDETCRLEPIENPFGPKVLPMCSE